MAIDLKLCLQAATEASRQAAEVLESWRRRFSVREKGRADLVTDADFAAQQVLRTFLLGQFPDHAFLGEEDGPNPKPPGPGAPPTWIVDPLDGTTNYVHDLPAYCVSIGLLADGELQVGVIFDPRMNELFAAAAGCGATMNGEPIRASTISKLDDALLATGFPPDLGGQDRQHDWWRFMALRTQSLRRTGSTALNMAYVAAGRFDGYWGFDNNPWDVAGGVVIVREAGGTVTAMDGSPYDCFNRQCIVSNGLLHADFEAAMREGP